MVATPSRIVGHIVHTDGTRTNFEMPANGQWIQNGGSVEELTANVDLLDAMSRHLASYLTAENKNE